MSHTQRQRLDGRTAIVTGGIGLLGRRFCDGFAEMGARVAVVDLDGAAAERFAGELQARHAVPALGIACDVTQPDSVQRMTQRVLDEWQRIDILHSNAASKGRDLRAFFEPFETYSPQVWREVMAVNVDGMFLVAQHVGRAMLAQRSGTVIQTASIYGVVGPDERIYEGSDYLGGAINTPAVYAASKAAVIGLTRYLATHWAAHGIRVNCIVPGGVESGQNDEFRRRYAARTPLGRMGLPDEIVGAALFLASDAASYVTGQVLGVDGGWTAW